MENSQKAPNPTRPNNGHGTIEETEHIIKIHLDPFVEITERQLQSREFFSNEKAIHKSEAEALVCIKKKIDDPFIGKVRIPNVKWVINTEMLYSGTSVQIPIVNIQFTLKLSKHLFFGFM